MAVEGHGQGALYRAVEGHGQVALYALVEGHGQGALYALVEGKGECPLLYILVEGKGNHLYTINGRNCVSHASFCVFLMHVLLDKIV